MKFNIMKFSSSALKNGGYIKAAEIMIKRSRDMKVLGVISSIKGSVELLNDASILAAEGKLNEAESKVNELYKIYLEEVNIVKARYNSNVENKLLNLKKQLIDSEHNINFR
jgi:hypothetical protein